MSLKDLVILPNTGIVPWTESFGTNQKSDYGLEFLTEVSRGRVDIPDANRYRLPRFREIGVSLRESVGRSFAMGKHKGNQTVSKVIYGVKKSWENRSIPDSIKALDVMRSDPSSPFFVDLLKPRLYDSTYGKFSGISLASDFLCGYAYLLGSIIASGSIRKNPKGYILGSIYVPTDEEIDELQKKLHGVVTEESPNCIGEAKRDPIEFRLLSPYSRLLNVMGLESGKRVNKEYDDLGLHHLESFFGLYSGMRVEDKNHTKNVFSGFVQGVSDHKERINDEGSKEIILPKFSNLYTATRFTAFFCAALRLSDPTLRFTSHPCDELYITRETQEEKIKHFSVVKIDTNGGSLM